MQTHEEDSVRHEPRPGEIWEHFKSTEKEPKKYAIIAVAVNASNGSNEKKVVVYHALYGKMLVYCRDLTEFMSEVDHEKYPNARQKYRFECCFCRTLSDM